MNGLTSRANKSKKKSQNVCDDCKKDREETKDEETGRVTRNLVSTGGRTSAKKVACLDISPASDCEEE